MPMNRQDIEKPKMKRLASLLFLAVMTSGRAGGLPFAGPSKGPTRKRVKFTSNQQMKNFQQSKTNLVSCRDLQIHDSRKCQTLRVPQQSLGVYLRLNYVHFRF